MDSNRSNKRKGFANSKLLLKSFHRGGGKPKSDEFTANEAAMKAKCPPPPPPPASAAVGFIIMKQDQVFPPHHQAKVTFVVPDWNAEYAKLESFYDGGGGGDEDVDAKAARYISTVQERFRLEIIN